MGIMKKVKGVLLRREKNIQSDFKLSNVELGLFENEICNDCSGNLLELIVFNKLDMILELNKKLIAN